MDLVQQEQKKMVARRRWLLLVILWLLYIINYFDRTSVLTFLPLIREDLGLNHVQAGAISSLFFFAYALAQFSAGFLSDKIGPKRVMNVAIWTFTGITFLTGLMRNFWQFALLRVGLGLGEGHHFSPANKTIAEWFPKHERGRAAAFFTSTSAVAPAIIPVTVTMLAAAFNGWRPVFFILAIPGVVGVLLLNYFIHDTPKKALEKKKLSKDEYDYIISGQTEAKSADENVSEKVYTTKERNAILLKDRSFWCYALMMFCLLGIYWGNTTWISSFLLEQHGFSIKTMGLLASLPYLLAFLAQNGGGFAMDKIFKGKAKPVLCISFLSGIPCLLFIARIATGNIAALIAMLMLTGFCTNIAFGACYGYPLVRYPKQIAGSAVGFSNGIGQFGSFTAPLIAGALVVANANGSFNYSVAFGFFACLSAVAFVLALTLTDKPWAPKAAK